MTKQSQNNQNLLDNIIKIIRKDNLYTFEDEKSDADSRLYIKAINEQSVIKVDRGIVPINSESKKCDYLSVSNYYSNFIELKGKNHIDEAAKQISLTIDFLEREKAYSYLINKKKQLRAYIVSVFQQHIPDLNNIHIKLLSKKLFSKSNDKPKNMFDLLKYVKVVDKISRPNQKLKINNRQIMISNKFPLELE